MRRSTLNLIFITHTGDRARQPRSAWIQVNCTDLEKTDSNQSWKPLLFIWDQCVHHMTAEMTLVSVLFVNYNENTSALMLLWHFNLWVWMDRDGRSGLRPFYRHVHALPEFHTQNICSCNIFELLLKTVEFLVILHVIRSAFWQHFLHLSHEKYAFSRLKFLLMMHMLSLMYRAIRASLWSKCY